MERIKLNARGVSHLILPLVVIVLVGLIGTYFFVMSHAATNVCASEGGTVSGGVCYFWAWSSQKNFVASGVSVGIYQAGPKLSVADSKVNGHITAELNFSDASGKDAVETGWIVESPTQTRPYFFANDWRNGKYYDTTGWVPAKGATVRQNGPLAVGTVGTFEVIYQNSQWQVYYDNKEVGYFPESLWGDGVFTHIKEGDVYAEVVASTTTKTTTQMGNGLFGARNNSAYFTHYALINSATAPNLTVVTPIAAESKAYTVGNISKAGFHYGGPGF